MKSKKTEHKYRNALLSIGVVTALLMSVVGVSFASSGTPGSGGVGLTGNVVGLSCGIDVTPNAVSFSGTANGIQEPANSVVTVTDSGNIDGALTLSGSVWSINGNAQSSGSVAWTQYGFSANPTSNLNANGVALGNVMPTGGSSLPSDPNSGGANLTDSVYFGFTPPVYSPSGAYSQTLLFLTAC
jgi:hypothetical protein